MYRLQTQQSERQDVNQISMGGKATVKKQFSNRFNKFNEINGKENEYTQSNLLRVNLNKNTVRKLIDQQNDENEQLQYCANHADRKSQYLVKIEGQILKYCRKCATHIASQGFDVHKIGSPQRQQQLNNKNIARLSSNNILMDNNNLSQQGLLSNVSPNRGGRQSNSTKDRIQREKRMQLLTLVKSLKGLREQYRVKQQNLTEISETFSNQKDILNSYYDELVSYIQEIRDIHLQAIDESAINTVQVCEIQKGEVEETLGEIEEMVADIECNLENIITQVDEQNYAQCFEFYKQKECIFSHRLEELGAEAKPWPCSSQEEMSQKIQQFKQFINQLHQVGDQPNQDEQQQAEHHSYLY